MRISTTKSLKEWVGLFTREGRIFYPLVLLAVILPNLALGVYGYLALHSQADLIESRIEEGYLASSRVVSRSVTRRIAELEDDVLDRASATSTAKDAAVILDEGASAGSIFRVGLLLDGDGRLVALPPGGDPTPARDARIEAFATGIREHLVARLNATPVWHRQHLTLILENPPEGTPQECVFYLQRIASMGTAVLWLDMRVVREDILRPAVSELRNQAGLDLSLHVVDSPDTRGADILLSESLDPRRFPGWRWTVHSNRLETAWEAGQRQAGVYLLVVAIFIPILAFGTVVALRQILKEIREARAKTDFVSRVTHELKTPLTSIRMFIETLELGHAQTDEERKHCIRVIGKESDRLAQLIDRVLEFSKMEAGNKVYHFRHCDVEQVIRDTIDFFRHQAPGVSIRLYIEKDLPETRVDPEGVREVLLNLLDNAVKYSVKDKVVAIRVTHLAASRTIHIQVIDNGVGIPKEDLDKVFTKFYRIEDARTRGIDGSGLGLTLCREIALAHGGELLVESERGRGSKFTLVLPVAGPAEA